jgi:hypothetical protein
VKLRDGTNGREYEIDYAYLFINSFTTAYNLVLGQAKNFIDFTEDEIRRMGELAQKFAKRPYLAFSSLKDTFSEEEKRLLRELVAQGHKVIALTRLELDPYHLYTRFEGAPHRYAHSLDDLSENTLHLNVGRAPAA